MEAVCRLRSTMRCMLAGAALLTATCASAATAWPDRPLRLVVPFPAGGSYDIIGRTLARKLEQRLGQPVVVENIAGGATVPGVSSVLKEKADGNTLLLASDGTLSINPYTIKGLRYRPDDLTPVTIVSTVPHWIITRADRKETTLSELKRHIQRNPGKVSISINVVAGAAHLGLADWKRRNGLDFTIVPYRGSPPAMADLIGGQTYAHVDVIGSSVNYVQDGKARPLAVLQAEPVTQFSALATQRAGGADALQVRGNLALVVKTGTPAPVIDRLYQEVKASVHEADFAARLKTLAYEPVLSTPEQARRFLQAETIRYGAIARAVDLESN
ncbi:tripartite tricarboxylate transporter substrate binding protein [Cupriavidus sp. WGlv3]|uniref:Bug family tripartite tricarboxylate transporter substrate binding protein n=1 Tax=Cupriavidus sp. WGlv3 TaxID=2919924 RepID=UPI0020906EBC|nr:tripartite tricarboxylate transporter substrate binding protein [Cupriavidus sp. WGlv3]MCO4863128.1 tripartite tricarboxylate transporter substrate binding protein [Cupriavidus sp. WGlv3]